MSWITLLLSRSHRKESWGSSSRGIHYGRYLSFPFWMFGTPPAPWQTGLLQVLVQAHCPSGLSGTYVLPPSALALWCEGTFHATRLTSGESQDPTWGTCPGKAQSPPLPLTLSMTSLLLWHVYGPPGPSPFTHHNAKLTGLNN